MTTSLSELDATLTAALQPDGTLGLSGTLLGDPALGSLIGVLCPSGVLTVAQAKLDLASDGQSLTLTGTTQVGTLTGAAISVVFRLGSGGALEMTAKIALPDGTALSALLSPLGDPTQEKVTLDGGSMILSSQPYDDPGTGRSLAPGLSLTGSVVPVALLPYLGAILPASTRLALAGPVDCVAPPLFDLETTAVSGSFAGVALPGLSLGFVNRNLAAPGQTPVALSESILRASLSLGGITGQVSAPLPAGGESLALEATFKGLTLTGLADLAPFIGTVNPFEALPAPVASEIEAVASAFALTSLGLTADLSAATFRSVSLGISVDLKGYNIFAPLTVLAVNELDITFSVDMARTPALVRFGASAVIPLSDYAVLLSFQTQSTGGYLISVAQAPGAVLKLTQVLETFLPDLMEFPDFDVETFGLLLMPESGSYSFQAVISSDWQILPTPQITLTEIDVGAAYNTKVAPATSGWITGQFALAVDSDPDNDITITLSAVRPQGVDGWLLTGQTGAGQAIPIGNLVTAIVREFSTTASVPGFLAGLAVENLDLSFDTAQTAFHFGTEIEMPFSDDVVLKLTVSLDVVRQTESGGYETTFAGTILVSQYEFDIVFDDQTAKGDTLIATYRPADGARQQVTLKSLVAGISESLAEDIPIDIEIDLQDVKFVLYKDTQSNRMAFGLDVGLQIGLSDIPIVGSKLPPDLTLAVTNLQGVYATAAFPQTTVASINALMPPKIVHFPSEGLGQGVNLAADVRIGNWTEHFQLAGGTQSTQPPPRGAAAQVTAAAPAPAPAPAPTGTAPDGAFKWININKQIGIFQFDRIGAGYQNNLLSLAIDAGISLGPLGFSMLGLSAGTPMDRFAPQFDLNGLGLSFTEPPVRLSGAFLKVADKTGTSYYGQAMVQVASIGFSALGGWSPDADPASFFLYANVDIPLGGPPYLQLKAISGGIGINRSLLLPTITELAGYILLPNNAPPAPATPQGTVATVLPQLEKYFVDEPGEYWIAAGIAFSSFEMIEAYALVTVSFGVEFQLGILGSLSMSIPTLDAEPIAYVEADLVASFAPASGLLSLQGVLSPKSFVFGGFVKIEGGFACCLWFSKEHAGDFVVSVGGYYPSFDKPSHYPTVPRIRIGFALGPVSVTGSAYFALTPAMLMAGMSMNASFSAGPIKAWFDTSFDMLIAWSPFHYQVGTYIDIGVSVDLGLFTLKLQAGADLAIWGPSFGGKADVDLDVVSFSFAFGSAPSAPTPVGWATFSQTFLPPDSPAPSAAPAQRTPAPQEKRTVAPTAVLAAATPGALDAAAPEDGSSEDGGPEDGATVTNVLKVTVPTGMVSSAVPGYDAIISATAFEIQISSTVPANAFDWTAASGPLSQPDTVKGWSAATPVAGVPFLTLPADTRTFSDTEVWNPDLDVAPMTVTGVTSRLTVGVLKHSDSDPAGVFSDPITDIAVAPMLMPSTTALWKLQDVSSDPNLPALLDQTLVGLSLTPLPRTPDRVSDVPLIDLLYAPGDQTGFYPAQAAVVPGYGVSATDDPTDALVITLTGAHDAVLTSRDWHLTALVDPWVSAQRTAVAEALVAAGFGTTPPSQIDVTTFATRKALSDWPMVRQLGA